MKRRRYRAWFTAGPREGAISMTGENFFWFRRSAYRWLDEVNCSMGVYERILEFEIEDRWRATRVRGARAAT